MKWKDVLFLTFMGLLTACALVFTGMVLWNNVFFPSRGQPTPQTRPVAGWKQLPLEGARGGAEDAPVQIMEFFDYQCPYCKRAKPAVEAIRKKYPRKVSVVYENNPLPMHEHARGAAIAAECARIIAPEAFMAYHDSLFARQQALGVKGIYMRLARHIGLADTASFHRCLQKEIPGRIIAESKQLADSLGIHGIPTFIINGTLVNGALSKQQLDGFVQNALNKAGK